MSFLRHPFHLVSPSPLPLLASLTLSLLLFLVWTTKSFATLLFSLTLFLLVLFSWFRDIIRESTFIGFHTYKVRVGLRFGFLLFLLSEVFLFGSFFWAYLHGALSPDHCLGGIWPPSGLSTSTPFGLPLLNTVLLLSSAFTLTWSHHSLLSFSTKTCAFTLSYSLILGLFFIICQIWEYKHLAFTISDSLYGSVFYLGTGFHGLHVLFGLAFLFVGFIRLLAGHLRARRHLGFLCAIWYWHFVDVIWLFLFLVYYVWGF